MKRFLIILPILILTVCGYSQSISVSSFKLLESDLTANTAGTTERDQNGEVAALIKVVTTQTGFSFDCGSMGIVKTVQKPAEIWVYVPHGIKKMTISHPQLGLLRDYYLNVPIEKARTYEMVLVSVTVQTIVQQARTSQYVVFQLVPPNAIVELDGNLLQTIDGTASKMMKFGTYNYRIQAPNYLPEAGNVTVDDPDNKIIVNISLKPNFSKVTIKVDNNAEIWVNGERKGNGTWTGELGEGTYEFEAKLQGYRTTLITKDIVVTQEPQIITLQAPTPIYGEADINSSPAMADIYIDGKKSGQTPQLISKLLVGTHQIRITKSGYDDHTSTLTIKEGETASVTTELKKKVIDTPKSSTPAIINNNNNKDEKRWRFGFVNSPNIIQSMPEYTKARSEILALTKRYETDLKSMQDKLQKKSDDFEKEQATLPANIKQRREQELQDMYQKIQQMYQEHQQALAKEKKDKMESITGKVLEAIKIEGNKKKLLYVFDTSSGVILNTNIDDDLTGSIKKRLGLSSSSEYIPGKKVANKAGYIRTSDIFPLLNLTNETDSITKQRIIEKVNEAIQTIAIRYDFAFIVDSQSGIPFINTTYICDVTQLVEKELGLTNETPSVPNKYIDDVAFGHLNSQDIIQAMPEFTKARTEIEALTKQYEADLKSMQEELQKKSEAYEKEQATLPANIKQRREQELQDMYQKIQQMYQDNQQALAKEQQEKMQAITTKVLDAIHQVGNGSKYAFIMDLTSGLPYISTTLSTDVTKDVKAKLGL